MTISQIATQNKTPKRVQSRFIRIFACNIYTIKQAHYVEVFWTAADTAIWLAAASSTSEHQHHVRYKADTAASTVPNSKIEEETKSHTYSQIYTKSQREEHKTSTYRRSGQLAKEQMEQL